MSRELTVLSSQAVPQVRTIMTILLVMKWHQVSTPAVRSPVLLVWLGSAIRQAQILGLHVLGDDPEIMPPDDPAWPPGKNSIKRQSALRLWNILAFNDCAASTPRFRAYMIHEQQCTSGPPANVDDSELSMTTWEIKPKPKRVMTSASVNNLKHEVASQTKLVFDQLQRASSPAFTYDTVRNDLTSLCLSFANLAIVSGAGPLPRRRIPPHPGRVARPHLD